MVVTKEKKSEYNRRYREKQALKQENEIKEPKKETKKETKKKDKEIKIETVSPSFLSKYGSYLLPAVLPLVKGIFFLYMQNRKQLDESKKQEDPLSMNTNQLNTLSLHRL